MNNTNDDVRYCPLGKNLNMMCHKSNYATDEKISASSVIMIARVTLLFRKLYIQETCI
jgi:hypothetical protein